MRTIPAMLIIKKLHLMFVICMCISLVSVCAAQQDATTLDTVYSQMQMTQADKDVTGKLKDKTADVLLDNAFYWMMKKVSALPQLSDNNLKTLDSPSYANILRQPDRYRFMPMRMNVYVYTVQKLTSREGFLTANPYWPGDKPIYRITATNQVNGKSNRIEPLIIYCDKLPPNLPDNPKIGKDGIMEFPAGPLYEVAGVFLKYTDEVSRDEKLLVSYPVILAWQFNQLQAIPISNTLAKLGGLIAVLIIVLGVSVYFFLKKRVRKIRKPMAIKELFEQYKDDDLESTEDETPDGIDNSTIPPELTQAARDFRQQHGLDNEPRKD